MMDRNYLVIIGLAYLALAKICLTQVSLRFRDISFVIINFVAAYLLFQPEHVQIFRVCSAIYIVVVLIQYGLLKKYATKSGNEAWIAVLFPIFTLILVKYIPPLLFSGTVYVTAASIGAYFIGISYLAFRSSHLALEVRNNIVKLPTLTEYFGFCFFAPTLLVGPISPYSLYSQSLRETSRKKDFFFTAFYRLVIGGVKFLFLAGIFNQLSYQGLLQDGHPHGRIDVVVAAVFYYFYLYCNFAGFCDMAVGSAGILGIRVKDNFDEPLTARNIKEFWNKWHITLSLYMRDMVFSPLSKYLVRKFGVQNSNHCIAVSIFVVFLIVGLWHGVGWAFVIFGLIHATGMVIHHYYTVALKKNLGKDKFKSYNQSVFIKIVSTLVTFTFVTVSFAFFANTLPQTMHYISVLWRGVW